MPFTFLLLVGWSLAMSAPTSSDGWPIYASNGPASNSANPELLMNTLTWNDLFIDASILHFADLLSEWPGLEVGNIRPIGASAFGDLFFERQSGEVMKLDVLEGALVRIAVSVQQFGDLMNSVAWQEHHLLSQGVALLKEKGISRGSDQFFGFAPHPAVAGKIDWARVMSLDAVVWNAICAQTLGAVAPEEAGDA
jgi:hypothetical protein